MEASLVRLVDPKHAVRDRYTAAAQAREAALCCPVDYDPQYLKVIPEEVLECDYGCGDPSRYAREGDVVLDLGSGGGKVCFIASQIVGAKRAVVGIDMNGTAEPRDAGIATSTLAASLSQLDLSTLQRARIEKLFGAEERRLVALREVWTDLDTALRRAEIEQPFDEDLVSSLVAQQAELAGYARGAESRIVSSILSLLTPEQSHRFVELRLGHVDQLALLDGA